MYVKAYCSAKGLNKILTTTKANTEKTQAVDITVSTRKKRGHKIELLIPMSWIVFYDGYEEEITICPKDDTTEITIIQQEEYSE